MKTPLFFTAVFFFAAITAAFCTAQTVKKDSTATPNVILIMLDDVGFCDLACYGNKLITTPNIDWLHKNSVRMTNYHSSTIGTQTAAALMTGRYPERMGVWRDSAGRNILRFGEFTLPELMKNHGYRTAVYGKWHLGDGEFYRPEYRGFDESLVITAGGLGQIPDAWGNTDDSPIMRHNGIPVKTRGNITQTLFSAANEFSLRKDKKPFFIYLPLTVCAAPYRPTEKYVDHFLAAGVEKETAMFYSLLCEFDEHLGKMLLNLRKNQLLGNTIIIFTSDNGSFHAAYNRVFSGSKGSLLDGGHRVPFFIFWERELRKHAGQDVDRLVAHIDVAPTILEISGVSVPRKVVSRFDGVSFRPLLLTAGEAWYPRTLLMQPREVEKFQNPAGSILMTEQYRLLNGKDLYDVQKDPRQGTEISASFPSEMKTFEKIYKKWKEEAVDEEGSAVNPIFVTGDLTFSQKLALKTAVQETFLKTEKIPDEKARWEIIASGKPASEKNPEKNAKKAPPATVLTCYDWRLNVPLIYPQQLAELPADAGVWDTEFLESGTYEFSLRISPELTPRPIPAATAFLQLNDKPFQAAVPQNATDVKFRQAVPAGKVKIRGMFQGSGSMFGAYFVTIRKIGKP